MAKFGGTLGTMIAGADMWMRHLKIGLPFTMRHKHRDSEMLVPAAKARKIDYPKPDNVHQLRSPVVGVSVGREP